MDEQTRERAARAWIAVTVDLLLAFLLALLLTPVLLWLGRALQLDAARVELFAEQSLHAVDLPSPEGPRAEALLAGCARAAPEVDWRLLAEDGAVWLVGPGGAELPEPARALWTGELRLENEFTLLEGLEEDGVDPDSWLARTVPWLVAASAIAFLVVGALARRLRTPATIEAEPPRRGSLPSRLFVGVVAGIVALTAVIALDLALRAIGFEQQEQAVVERTVEEGGTTLAWLALVAVVLVPLGEETFFRGHVFAHLRREANRPLAYFASAAMFAVAHLNPSAIPSYLVYGIVLAAVYERTRSVLACTVAHAVVNGAAAIIFLTS